MKFYLKYIVVVCGFLSSCKDDVETLPESIIARDKMVEVIAEVELTQALIKLKLSARDTLYQKTLYSQVYQKFEISETEFNNSLHYYCSNPKEMMDVYLEAIERLSERQVEDR